MSVVADSIRDMEKLISQKKYRKARKLAEQIKQENYSEISDSASFWFEYGLTVRLTDYDEEVLKQLRKSMRECSNYLAVMDGDWLRNDALHNARKGNPAQAKTMMVEVRKLHAGDQYRKARATLAEAEIAYYSHEFEQVYNLHEQAVCNDWPDFLREDLPYMNSQVLVLKSLVKIGCIDSKRRQSADSVIHFDTSFLRRLRGRLIDSGRLGNAIDDRLMRLFA